eukprot:3690733-Lingulodinium_polyedra.AAC.1
MHTPTNANDKTNVAHYVPMRASTQPEIRYTCVNLLTRASTNLWPWMSVRSSRCVPQTMHVQRISGRVV